MWDIVTGDMSHKIIDIMDYIYNRCFKKEKKNKFFTLHFDAFKCSYLNTKILIHTHSVFL